MRAVQWWGCITPIACMPAGMQVRQQVAALGIVFFIRVLQYLSVYNVHATGCDVIVRHIEEDPWVLVVCVLCSRIHRGGLRQRRCLPEVSSKQRMLAW